MSLTFEILLNQLFFRKKQIFSTLHYADADKIPALFLLPANFVILAFYLTADFGNKQRFSAHPNRVNSSARSRRAQNLFQKHL